MALVVEDGSIVAGADSYVTRADFITYAAAFGVTIANTAATDVQLVKAAQFIESHEGRLIGDRKTRDQSLAYPRTGLIIEGWDWNDDEIPRQVILCQMQVALEINAGIDPYNPPANPARATRREKVEGAVEVEYFGNDSASKMSRDSSAKALLSSLLKNAGLMSVPVVRV